MISSDKITAQLVESILLEAGMLYVTTQLSDLAEQDIFHGPLPDFVIIDLDKTSLNVFNLVKFINGQEAPTRWIYYGSDAMVETIAKLVNPPYTHLASPLNPLVLLNLMHEELSEKSKSSTTLSG